MSRAWDIANSLGKGISIKSDPDEVPNSEEVRNIVYGYDTKEAVGDLPDGTIYIYVNPKGD